MDRRRDSRRSTLTHQPLRALTRARSFAHRRPDVAFCFGILLVGIAANLLYLTGWFDPNPLHQISGLGSVVRRGLLPGQDTIDPNNGFNTQAFGHLAAVDWRHGVAPWWNHYAGVGSPLAGEMQSAALFPLVLLLGLAGGQVLFHLVLQVLTGIATYLLLRRLLIPPWVAFAGGGAFLLNGTFAWFAHAPVNPIAFLPLLLLGVEMIHPLAPRRRAWGWAVIALAVALSLYAGFPETAYIDGLFAVGWIVVRALEARGDRRAAARFLAKVAAGGIVGLLLSAPIVVAFVDYLGQANTGGHSGAFAHASLVRAAAPMTTLPYVYGPIFGFSGFDGTGKLAAAWGSIGGYTTTGLLVFAVVGLIGRSHRPLRILLGAWAAVALGRTFGVPLFSALVNSVPQMKNIAFYRYAPVSWEFAVVVLACFGLHDVVTAEAPWSRIALAGAAALAVTVAAAVAALPVLHRLTGAPHHRVWALASAGWGAAVIVAGVGGALLARRHPGGAPVLLALLVVLDSLVMFVVPELSAPRAASYDAQPVVFLRAHLGSSRFFSLGPLAPNYGSFFRVASVDQNDIPFPKLWADYLTKNLDPNVDPILFTGTNQLDSAGPSPAQAFVDHLAGYEAVGVKYVVLPASVSLPPPSNGAPPLSLPPVFSDPAVQILELPQPKPFVEVVAGDCQLSVVDLDTVQSRCQGPAMVERRELYMPGWHASLAGRDVSVARYDDLFQRVDLPAGQSTVRFEFVPPFMTAALLAMVAGLLLLIVPLVVVAARSRPARPLPPDQHD